MLLNSSSIVIVALLALCCALIIPSSTAAFDRNEVYSGVVFQNGFIHRVNASEPVDPNKVIFAITGTPKNGYITHNVSAPPTFCVPGVNPPSCGKAVQDITVTIRSRHGRLTVESLVNNPSPYSFGLAQDLVVDGEWTRDRFHLVVSYVLIINRPGFIVHVPYKFIYTGKVDRQNVFVGMHYGFVAPYLNGALTSYRYIVTYGTVNTAESYSMLAGYRVISPYGSASDPYQLPAPIPISGTIFDATFSNGMLQGRANLASPTGLVNLTNVPFTSDYDFIDESRGFLRVNNGWVTDGNGNGYLLDSLNMLVVESN